MREQQVAELIQVFPSWSLWLVLNGIALFLVGIMSMGCAPAVGCEASRMANLLLMLLNICRKGNVEDFISYGFYAKRTEDLTEEVGLRSHVLTLLSGRFDILLTSIVCIVMRAAGNFCISCCQLPTSSRMNAQAVSEVNI